MATEPSILGHSSVHFEDLQLSSDDFYNTVEETIKEFEFPDVKITRASFQENSMFSAYREYLCIKRNEYTFYVCAAPFGRSFFISWWLKEREYMRLILFGWIPFVGTMLRNSIASKSFFQVDSENIFKESIKKVVDKTIAEIGQTKGLRLEAPQLTN